jgi:hypothetical protein
MSDFSQQQAKHVRQLLSRPPVQVGKGSAEGFLLRYVFFEALMKLVGRYYWETRCPQRKQPTGKDPLNIIEVEKLLQFFQRSVHSERLALLLDSSRTRRNQKAAREPRNGIVHSWDVGDCREAVNRYVELQGAMTGIVAMVSERVSRVAV